MAAGLLLSSILFITEIRGNLCDSNGKKRAALVLRGLSVADAKGRGPIDWRASYQSLRKHYIEPRLSANYTVDIFYHTYNSPYTKEIENVYKPKASRTTDYFIGKNRFAAQQKSLLLGLELVHKFDTVYDEVCATRFDLLFLQPVTDWRLSHDAFNVPFQDIDRRKHCDVIWIFPGSILIEIIRDLKHIIQHPPHHNARGGELHYYRPKSIPLNFLFDQKFSSDTDWPERFVYNTNPLYKLHRTRGGGSAAAASSALSRTHGKKDTENNIAAGVSHHSPSPSHRRHHQHGGSRGMHS